MSSTLKRDTLREIERQVQEYWNSSKFFETDAPAEGEDLQEKFFVTFPYPYMNGRLHLGHSFTLSKPEFAVGFEKLRGKRTLFPLAFHCTGMPIKSCADKLKRELEEQLPNSSNASSSTDQSASTKKVHSKIAAKTGNAKSQMEIMQQLGVSLEEIPKFADSSYWLSYFPPLAKADATSLGLKIDWRRSFITTDCNPLYDSFIKWQFHRLRAQGKIKFGSRHTIYSPIDGQACLDHDRSSGEGFGPQEYVMIKMKLLNPPASIQQTLPNPKIDVYLGAATLRPETMYAQTNCWVSPDIYYGIFALEGPTGSTVIVITERAARNLKYQGYPEIHQLGSVTGSELLGLKVQAPLSFYYPIVYVLPMLSVSAAKGTGIVTSVPSDSPDDWASLRDLQEKEAFRKKFSLPDEAVLPFTPKPVIKTVNWGEMCAVSLVESLGIKSQNDRDQLAKAKEIAYQEGFYKGEMLLGEHAGRPVHEVKEVIKAELIQNTQALFYWEPERKVISRSGDECVVGLVDQWYITYGEESWKAQAKACLEQMQCFHEETKNQFLATLDWLNQWACSRSYGLGSRVPWDPQFLIESLSDSTIYMAYYTVAHLIEGSEVDASNLTDEFWDYIFDNSFTRPSIKGFSNEQLDRMRREFEYFYPVDVRYSGKDLIPNHLTFFIYNHVALFPPKYWPRGVRANGHLLLNNEKMSKSTGNFMTLHEAVQEFGADSVRLALADAGDDFNDANFVTSTCNSAILTLYNLLEFMRDQLNSAEAREASNDYTFNDRVFDNEINQIVRSCYASYEGALYREVVVQGFHELLKAHDRYRDVTRGAEGMHKQLILKFITVFALILSPIIPHTCEHIWRHILGNSDSSITQQTWPKVDEVDEGLIAAKNYISSMMHAARTTLQAEQNPKKGPAPSGKLNKMQILVALDHPEWQRVATDILKSQYAEGAFKLDDSAIAGLLKANSVLKEHLKKVMPFAMEMKKRVEAVGPSAFERKLPFDEVRTLELNMNYLCRSLDLLSIQVEPLTEGNLGQDKKAMLAMPGEPKFKFSTCE